MKPLSTKAVLARRSKLLAQICFTLDDLFEAQPERRATRAACNRAFRELKRLRKRFAKI